MRAQGGSVGDIERVMVTAHVYPLDVGRNRRAQVGVGLPLACDLLRGAVGIFAVDKVTADDDAVGQEARDERCDHRFGARCAGGVAETDVKVCQVYAAHEPISTCIPRRSAVVCMG
jgi:hypothetical protein